MLPVALLAIHPAEAADFEGVQTGPNEWTYTLTYDPLDNYAVCPAPGNVATIMLSGLQGVVGATAPTSTDFDPPGGALDTVNLAWAPAVSGGGTVVTWTHIGSGTGNFGVAKHVFGFKLFTATPMANGTVNVDSEGFSHDVSVTGPCPVQPADDRDFSRTTNGPVTLLAGIDIQPSSFNCRRNGNMPVAILGSATLDVATVDLSTVKLNGIPALPKSGVLDANGDAYLDRMVFFDNQAVSGAIGCAALQKNAQVLVTITGSTTGGLPFSGADVLRIANP